MTRHAQQRAKERYGMDLSYTDINEIIRACLSGSGLVMPWLGETVTVYAVEFRGCMIYPMLENATGNCITMLSRDAFSSAGRRMWMSKLSRKRRGRARSCRKAAMREERT